MQSDRRCTPVCRSGPSESASWARERGPIPLWQPVQSRFRWGNTLVEDGHKFNILLRNAASRSISCQAYLSLPKGSCRPGRDQPASSRSRDCTEARRSWLWPTLRWTPGRWKISFNTCKWFTATDSRFSSCLKRWILCIVGYDKAEVGSVFLKVVFLFQLRRQLSKSNHGCKTVALAAVLHTDVETVLVTSGADGRQD